MNVIIRSATINDSETLTRISFASKRYWNYPEKYFEIWKDELTITPTYITNNIVYVAEMDGQAIGYFSLVEVKEDFWAGRVFVNKGFWLEHIFILPEHIGAGIGSNLVAFLKEKCKEINVDKVNIFVDPNAKGFYDKIKADYLGEELSSIEGRKVALYKLQV
ncbi:Acetyltransferase (GNAT) family protein [Sporomusa ovata DSM 2662]|uniref:GCN5-related N-acetyltransferase n=1 Tax=Sporomusa ovata TaxID=2378 RepID=A0A0U1L0E8_9FIRM|nr:GNAT family N-acetyltransferase [Sporomusa ovata]EQB27307.1 putative acetyltransferase [Sporomusa ovata DSM 2662]CQR73147.1 GCN5-related N-acetyltransferase [Sporomusa ovata]